MRSAAYCFRVRSSRLPPRKKYNTQKILKLWLQLNLTMQMCAAASAGRGVRVGCYVCPFRCPGTIFAKSKTDYPLAGGKPFLCRLLFSHCPGLVHYKYTRKRMPCPCRPHDTKTNLPSSHVHANRRRRTAVSSTSSAHSVVVQVWHQLSRRPPRCSSQPRRCRLAAAPSRLLQSVSAAEGVLAGVCNVEEACESGKPG